MRTTRGCGVQRASCLDCALSPAHCLAAEGQDSRVAGVLSALEQKVVDGGQRHALGRGGEHRLLAQLGMAAALAQHVQSRDHLRGPRRYSAAGHGV